MTTDQHWDQLVREFRRLCLLRRQKKLMESEAILHSDLPRTIAAWSKSFNAEPSVKKSRLDAMFQAEQRRIEDVWVTQELITARMNEQLIPEICSQVVREVRFAVADEMAVHNPRVNTPARNEASGTAGRSKRVAFDDVPGIIDLVLAEEQIRENSRLLETAVCQ